MTLAAHRWAHNKPWSLYDRKLPWPFVLSSAELMWPHASFPFFPGLMYTIAFACYKSDLGLYYRLTWTFDKKRHMWLWALRLSWILFGGTLVFFFFTTQADWTSTNKDMCSCAHWSTMGHGVTFFFTAQVPYLLSLKQPIAMYLWCQTAQWRKQPLHIGSAVWPKWLT